MDREVRQRLAVLRHVEEVAGARTCDIRSCVSMLLRSCAWPSVSITRRDAALAEFGQHGGGVDTQVLADAGEGPAEVVQMDGVIDLLGGQAPATHRNLMPTKDLADRPPLDTEPGTQLVHRLPTLISSDEFPDLIGVELTCPAGFGTNGARRNQGRRVGKFPTQVK
ncbi:hypothetical protein ABIA39_008173 [Nocardia sp. GAS34]|uniref:hypothetical protein n=1 Tax=unclassified Nocardia TaxID=2637762 RepID=UPI003D246F33